jgi:predicted nucleic acid-binding protein
MAETSTALLEMDDQIDKACKKKDVNNRTNKMLINIVFNKHKLYKLTIYQSS